MRSRLARYGPTIRDVAQLANVSVTTVSNVLNGRTGEMTKETLQRVQDAIAALDFHPNMAARGLVNRRSATVGVILSEIASPLFLQALPGMEAIARAERYNLLLCVASSCEEEKDALGLLLEKQVDGIILFSSSEYRDDAHVRKLRYLKAPLVLVNRATVHEEFDAVHWDQTTGVGQVVRYLVGRGHRRIAHLVGPGARRSTVERLEGYFRGLQECGLDYGDAYVRPGDYTAAPETWRRSARELIETRPRPTAIIASDDVVASIVMATVQDAGLRVPEDLAIVGIDDQPFCTCLRPALTSLRLPTIEAGDAAMQMLLGSIAGTRHEVEHVMLACPLIVRESSA